MLIRLYSFSRIASMTIDDGCDEEGETRHEVKKRLAPYCDRVVSEAERVAPCLAQPASLSKSVRVAATGIIEDAIIRLVRRDDSLGSLPAAVSSQTVGESSISFDVGRPLLGFASSGSVFNAAERKALRRLCGLEGGAYTVSMMGRDGDCGCCC